MSNMKKYIPWIIIAVVIIWLFSAYNGLVNKEENTEAAWAQVENVYQRRADLIPNLVNTVKGAADFEKGTLTDVIEARAKATSINVDPSNLSPEAIQQFQQAQDGLSSALARLMVVVERYPELKATENFSQLQAQLEGTENRIAVERRRFNEVVREYNTSIRRVPGNILAGIFGFERKGYFEAEEGSEKAPEVKF
ncbi:LemA family protein [Fulvivirga imtechensis AK7]|uniref:LemA family protein n=2 Tax=Fulvivirga TaxID=396811 RepID=L8JVL6_9BACT|nr:LemA family protein [Fulvivirga imtechensis AK7]